MVLRQRSESETLCFQHVSFLLHYYLVQITSAVQSGNTVSLKITFFQEKQLYFMCSIFDVTYFENSNSFPVL